MQAKESMAMRLSVGVCITLNMLLFVLIAARNPSVLREESLLSNPDAVHYFQLGRNMVELGVFSRQDSPPYVPDMLRTPAYPAFLGPLNWLAGPGAVFVATALAHAISCGILFAIANRLFERRVAVISSLLLAVDTVVISYNFSGMSETLSLLPLLAGVCVIVSTLIGDSPRQYQSLALGGLLIGFATLVRPATLYLGICLGIGLLVHELCRKRYSKAVLAGLTVSLCSVAPLIPWIARNHAVFSLAKLTTVDTANLVYFVGAGAFQQHFDISREQAQIEIAEEFGLPRYEIVQNPWFSSESPAQMDAKLKAAAPQILRRYPADLLASSVIGVVKSHASHGTEHVAHLLALRWTSPGFKELLRLDGEALRRLNQNSPMLVLTFVLQVSMMLLTVAMTFVGVIAGLRHSNSRWGVLLLLGVTAYLYFTIALFGIDAYYRCRIPVLPFLYLFAGVGISAALSSASRLIARTRGASSPSSLASPK
ncbi:ArnT family glycosyltransferase [Anatilimnocola sp. NA78]|uniref:ArnT family glycosyltransferase n=1 Tax=Anatilimnocola sp. NA78 TaxID=3415683 RepID=UPI003CE59AC2